MKNKIILLSKTVKVKDSNMKKAIHFENIPSILVQTYLIAPAGIEPTTRD